MSEILINGKKYDVKLNKMFIQPHLIINGMTTDVGIWNDISKDEEDKLLILAVKCYEYNIKNNTVVNSNSHIHQSQINKYGKYN